MGRGVRTSVRVAAAALALVALATQCGDDSGGGANDAEPTTSVGAVTTRRNTTTTTAPGPALVVNRRSMTAAETERIDDDDGVGALDCQNYGGVTWDYGPIGSEEPRGRQPDDALRDAILDLNEDADIVLSEAGWTELVERKGRSTFVHEEADWRALIVVLGDDDAGIWRHGSATVCSG